MFSFDEKRFFNDCHGHGHYPPEKPRYTMTEEVEHTARQMRETIDRLLKFEERATSEIDAMLKQISGDNVVFKSTMRDSWTTFIEEVKREINQFESNVDNTVTFFNSTITSDYKHLSEDTKLQIEGMLSEFTSRVNAFEEDIMERIERNSATIASTVEVLLSNMKESGELSNIIQNEVLGDITAKINRIISPEFYGAVGDGVADDTEALKECLVNNSFILLKGTYKITETLNFDNLQNVVLFGGKITRAKDETFNTIRGEKCSNIHILNVEFDGNGNNQGMDYEWMNNVQGCILLAGDASNIFIEKCVIKNYNYGIYVLGAELTTDSVNATIKDCLFRNCNSAIDTHGKNTLIDHNSFYDITENAIQIESEGTPTTDNPLIDNAYYYSAVCSRICNNMMLDISGTAIIIHDNAYGVKIDNNTIIDFDYAINANRDFRGCFIEGNTIIYQKSKGVSADKRPWDLSYFAIYCGKNTHVKNNYLKGCYVAIMGREGSVICGNEIVAPKISAIVVSSSDPTLIHFINDNVVKEFVKNGNAWYGALPIVLNSGLAILNNNLVYGNSEPIHSENAKAKITGLYSTIQQTTAITPLSTNAYSN